MGFSCGIVGLPNVGKSTLFNALTATQAAQAANFPFCTIEPNVGRVGVPDARLDKLAELAKSAKVIPTQLEFVDIAGLVRGASKGEGLGNQFLANIRETDCIIHVLRCFEGEVTHVEGNVDPLRDADTVETELMLADLDSLEKRRNGIEKKARLGDAESKTLLGLLDKLVKHLGEGKPARTCPIDKDEAPLLKAMQLITVKPVLYIANVSEDDAAAGNALSAKVMEKAKAEGTEAIIIAAAIESEVAGLPPADQMEFLEGLGLTEPGLNRIIRAGYKRLGLLTFFTVGPKEARAWTVLQGAKAPNAAGAIHTDFERGFIRAETIAYDDFAALGGESQARDAGKLRSEGKEYLVADGDIFNFRFNV